MPVAVKGAGKRVRKRRRDTFPCIFRIRQINVIRQCVMSAAGNFRQILRILDQIRIVRRAFALRPRLRRPCRGR